ncbi:Bacterial extracellular solute-binding protein, family 3 [Beggiatoa sp. PS]|nr:Bacterial extracellular solute-binding protein, family 3 [Beggiatoa sp. PS]
MNKPFHFLRKFSFLNLFRGLCIFLLLSFHCVGTVTQAQETQNEKPEKLRVVTKAFEPFVIPKENDKENPFEGFSIDLWNAIAKKMGRKSEFYQVETITELLDLVKDKKVDVGIAGISMTAEREKEIDFSYSFFDDAGLQIMVLEKSRTVGIISDIIFVIIDSQIPLYIGILLLVLFIAAHIIWLIERHHNTDFSKNYLEGIGDGFWWAAVTVATVGYGDKTPKGLVGRVFGVFWIFMGFFIVASFTASVTTTLTLQKLEEKIHVPDDLMGKKVATIKGSTAQRYLFKQIGKDGIKGFSHIDQAYQALESGDVKAIIYDAPVLRYYASHDGKGKVKLVGTLFNKESYAIALPTDSSLKEEINLILLKLKEGKEYKEMKQRWFGEEPK